MVPIKLNEGTAGRRRTPVLLVDITDSTTEELGVTPTSIVVIKADGTSAAGTGNFVETTGGNYYYEFGSDEVDVLGYVTVRILSDEARRFYGTAFIVAYDPYSATLGLTIPTVQQIVDGVWDEAFAGHSDAGSFGLLVQSISDDIDAGFTATASQLDDIETTLGDIETAIAALPGLTADAVWDELTAGHLTANTFGKAVVDILTLVSGIATDVDGIVITLAALPDIIIDGVWDEPIADHLDVGSTGAQLNSISASGIADAVWDELEAGHTTPGKAGYQLWTVLNLLLQNFTNSGIIPSTVYDTTTVIGRQLKCIRQFVDEPSTNAKYADDDILCLMRAAWTSLMVEVTGNGDNPLVARHSITMSNANRNYVLPPIVGEILNIAKLNTTTGLPDWVYPIRSRWNPLGPGILLEGNTIRLTPAWTGTTETIVVEFIPSGDIKMVAGTAQAVTSTTVTLPAAPSTGELDTREHAYAGALLRFTEAAYSSTSESVLQDRPIATYDAATRIATVSVPFDPVPDLGEGDLKIEIVPSFASDMELIICLHVASFIHSAEGDTRRRQSVEQKKAELVRNLKLRLARYENQVGDRFEHDTWSNTNYNPWWFSRP